MNLLLYATNPKALAYEPARAWFEDQINSDDQVGIPWFTLVSYLRLSTQPAVRNPPLPVGAAMKYVEEWLACETVWTPLPTERHAEVLGELLRAVPRSGMVSDAHVAALAIEHGLTLCTADVGFRMFPGLKVHNPLQ